MTFSYYLFWTFLPNFSRKLWLSHELLRFCQWGTKTFKKKFFFNFFLFLKQLFFQNISSMHYLEVVTMMFFIRVPIFVFVFGNKCIRIGNFVVFLSESMELTSDRLLTIKSEYLFFCFYFCTFCLFVCFVYI